MKNKSQSNFQKVFLISFLLFSVTVEMLAQSESNSDYPFIPLLNRVLTGSEFFQPLQINKKPGHNSKEDWQEVIDSVCRPGIPTSQKLEIYNTAWDTINAKYAAYQNLDVNIDSLRDLYRPEISSEIDIRDSEIEVLRGFRLFQNFPNPFNPTTTIKYQIPNAGFVTLKVYDVLGNERKGEGRYQIAFDASALSSGVYIYQIRSNDFIDTKKMILMK